MRAEKYYPFAPFRLDPVNQQLWRGEEEIPVGASRGPVLSGRAVGGIGDQSRTARCGVGRCYGQRLDASDMCGPTPQGSSVQSHKWQ